eukprot:jgi/Chrzof1/5710/Cz16g12190.t1
MHLLTFRMNPLGIVPGRLVLAESADGTFLGMAQLERMQIVKDKPTYEFRSLIVDPKYRHQGIGTALLMHVAGDCQDDVYLTTLNSTIGFYQRAGFNVVPPQSIPWWVAAYFVS